MLAFFQPLLLMFDFHGGKLQKAMFRGYTKIYKYGENGIVS